MSFFRKTVMISMLLILSGLVSKPLHPQDAPMMELSGFTTPYTTVNVGSGVMGIIDKMNVDRSDSVKKGQVLAVLDSRVERARVELAQAQLQMLDATIALQQTRLDFARKIYERKQSLFEKDTISTYDRDEAETNMRIGEKSLSETLEQKKVSISELKYTQEAFSRLTITSPISGIVVARLLTVGELVNETPLLQLAQLDPLNVEVIVPASYWGMIKVGMKANVFPEEPVSGQFQGTVKIVDKIIDAKSGTYGIRIEMPNPNNLLPAGLKCRVVIPSIKLETRS